MDGSSNILIQIKNQFYCYCKETELQTYAEIFKHILNSVEISKNAEYKPFILNSSSQDSYATSVIRNAIIGGLIGLVIAVIRRLTRKEIKIAWLKA